MSFAVIQKLVISSCRAKIDINACRKIVSSLNILQERTSVIKAEFPVYRTCIIHKRLFHDSAIRLEKINLEENGIDIDNISTFQIKKRPTRRNRVVISDDKILKSNTWTVKALATAEEYNLEALAYGLLDQQLYVPSKISTSTDRFKVQFVAVT